MKRRMTTVMAAWTAGVLAFVLLPLFGPAAPAGAATEDFTLSMTSGELLIRDAEEAFPIGLPTSVSGTNTDGQLTDLAFATPTISFVQEVPQYGTQAFIDAIFSMVGPGSGSINENGDVVVNISLNVDLEITVPILAYLSECKATPVNLTLTSTAPYDGETVTLAAPNFSVPEVPFGPTCINEVASAVNDALLGFGHSLTMTFAGDVTLPVAGEPTTTTMSVDPAAGSRLGQEVTLSAEVEPTEEPDEPVELPGSVTFYDGDANLGTAPLNADGEATLTTTGLSAGTRTLRAVYSGAPPDWQPSSSPGLPYTVASVPLVSTNLTGNVVVGGVDKEFTVSVRNADLGQDLDGVRVDVTIFRPVSGGSLSASTLAHVVDGSPVPVTLAGTGSQSVPLTGSIESDAWAAAPGDEAIETLRLTVPAGVSPGTIRVIFELVIEDDDEDVVLSSTSRDLNLTVATRVATALSAAVVTPIVRQGTIIEVYNLRITPPQGTLNPTGTVSFWVGGRPVLSRQGGQPSLEPWAPSSDHGGGALDFHLVVPEDMALGTHVVEARYSGNSVFAGSVGTWSVTVEPGRGEMYDCIYAGIRAGRFVANVSVLGDVPGVGVRGQDLGVERIDVKMYMSRTIGHTSLVGQVIAGLPTTTADFGLTGGGGGGFASIAQSGHTPMMAPGSPTDWLINLGGGTGTLPVAHDAGTTLEVGLESIVFDANHPSAVFTVSCQPFDESGAWVASVTSTGTSLTVEPMEPGEDVREGDDVVLTAQALPASPGFVEFLDGEATLGVAPVDALGVARMTTSSLPTGERTLTARYFGEIYPDSTSDPVVLFVERIDCIGFAEPGSGAVVRLIYMTVLNRCPDQPGFDFWVSRLDGGATRESVANAMAASHEARKVLVDEAYHLMLGRSADAEGKEFWATRLGQTGSYRELIGDLGSSGEFRALSGGTDAGIVDRLYDRLLRRAPTAADRSYWVGQIQTRGVRATVIKMFDLDEPLGTLVRDTYGRLIDRAPTTSERDAGVNLMRARSDRAALNASVINLNDFYTRAQSFPNVG